MNPTEYDEQIAFVRWLEIKGYRFTAIPNSTFTKHWNVKMRNMKMGVRAGFPDMVVIAERQFMCIEMKRKTGGSLSKFQKEWIEALERAGIPVAVCKGYEQAVAFVESIVRSKQEGH